MNWIKKNSIVILTTFVLILALIVLAELYGVNKSKSVNQPDEVLGWRLKENYSAAIVQKSLDGSSYEVAFETDSMGLRTFGSRSAPVKILVLGDSFTADPFASNQKMWYAKALENIAFELKRPHSDFFLAASGGGGWGNYQNLLLAAEIKETFKPDIFILQFCDNDFINNLYEWERTGIVRNQFMRRPYAKIEEGRFSTFYADHLFAPLYRSSVIGQSKVFNKIDSLISVIQYKFYGGYGPKLEPDVITNLELQSVSLTSSILSELREKFREVPAIMVNCNSSSSGPNAKWTGIAKGAGFIPLLAPSNFVSSIDKKESASLFHEDGGHLSELGNQKYGEIVAQEMMKLIRLGVLKLKN